jgi:hypothetical protein
VLAAILPFIYSALEVADTKLSVAGTTDLSMLSLEVESLDYTVYLLLPIPFSLYLIVFFVEP